MKTFLTTSPQRTSKVSGEECNTAARQVAFLPLSLHSKNLMDPNMPSIHFSDWGASKLQSPSPRPLRRLEATAKHTFISPRWHTEQHTGIHKAFAPRTQQITWFNVACGTLPPASPKILYALGQVARCFDSKTGKRHKGESKRFRICWELWKKKGFGAQKRTQVLTEKFEAVSCNLW